MKINTLFRRLAQDSGDYPIPVADAAERLQELRPAPPLTFVPTAFKGRLDPEADPSYCCEECENLTARIRRARQAVLITEFLLPDLEQELVELEAKHAQARLAESEVTP